MRLRFRGVEIKGWFGEFKGLRGDEHAQAFVDEVIAQRMGVEASGRSSRPAAL